MDVQAFAAPPVLELRDVTYRRDGSEIIHGVNFTVRAGERWAMLGPNGAGKSTILGFCGAVTHPSSGTVRVLGSQLGRVELQALRRAIGHVNPRHPLRCPPLPAPRHRRADRAHRHDRDHAALAADGGRGPRRPMT